MHVEVDAHQPHALMAVQPSQVNAAVAHGSVDVHDDETHLQVLQLPAVGPDEDPLRQELVDSQ